MVLFKTTLVGVGILALGLLLVGIIGPYVTFEVQEVHRRSVEPHAEFLVGDTVTRSYNLPPATNAVGTVFVTEAPSNRTSTVTFIVFDPDNYQHWTSGAQADSLYSEQNQGKLNFTFKTETAGPYYFVFDNRASLYKKYVVLTIAYDEITTKKVQDPRVGYAGWAVAVVGALILIYGLVRKPRVTWA